MESLSVGGLVSGLDTNSIIEGLVRIEQNRVVRERTKQEAYELKLNAFNDLVSKLGNFATKADALNKPKAFNLFKSTSSNEDIATVTGNEKAVAGTYQLKIDSMATSQKVTSDAFSSSVSALNLSGSFTIKKSQAALDSEPSDSTATIQVNSTDTLKDIANKINQADGAGANASIMKLGENDYRLVLNSTDEGTNGITLQETSGSVLTGRASAGTGLGLMSSEVALHSEFALKLKTIGAATTSTTLDNLFSGVGSSAGITAGDQITFSGKDGNGNTITAATYTVGDPATDTVQDVLTAIQAQFQSQGDASINVSLNSSGEIVMTSSGTSNLELSMSFTDADTSGSALSLGSGKSQTVFNNQLEEGKRAFYQINGLSTTSLTNKDDETIEGTVFELRKADPSEIVTVSLEIDTEGLQNKVQDFIDSYNEILSYLKDKSKVQLTDEDGKKSVGKRGPFAGETVIQRIRNELQNIFTGSISQLNGITSYSSFSSIGIKSSISDGTLSIDEDEFQEALENDFDGVRRLFITSGYSDNPSFELGRYTKDTQTGYYGIDADTDQFDTDKTAASSFVAGSRIGTVLSSNSGDSKGLSITAASGTGTGTFTFVRGIAGKFKAYYDTISDRFDGFITQTRDSIQGKIDRSAEKILDLEDSVENYRQRLVNEFSHLEQNLARLQSQSSSFLSQIQSL